MPRKIKDEIVLPVGVQSTVAKLTGAGFEAYVVGGAVRDSLLCVQPKDWDIATNAKPEQVMGIFKGAVLNTAGIFYGTVQITANGMPLEVTTYRKDGEYEDYRKPKAVEFGETIEGDLARRDFTVNAIAYTPKKGLVDPYNGIEDIKNKSLRCVGDANTRFCEDALRILRGVRFSAVTGFEIEEETSKAMELNKGALVNIKPERIFAELEKMVCGDFVKPVFINHGAVLAAAIPELAPLLGFEQKSVYHRYDVWQHTVESLALTLPKKPMLCLAVLLHDIGKPATCTEDTAGHRHFANHAKVGAEIAKSTLLRLKAPKKTVQTVAKLVELHNVKLAGGQKVVRTLLQQHGLLFVQTLLEVKRADAKTHDEKAADNRLKELAEAEKHLQNIIDGNLCYNLATLAVKGDDLLAIGYSGQNVGAALKRLLNAVVGEKVENRRSLLLDWLKRN